MTNTVFNPNTIRASRCTPAHAAPRRVLQVVVALRLHRQGGQWTGVSSGAANSELQSTSWEICRPAGSYFATDGRRRSGSSRTAAGPPTAAARPRTTRSGRRRRSGQDGGHGWTSVRNPSGAVFGTLARPVAAADHLRLTDVTTLSAAPPVEAPERPVGRTTTPVVDPSRDGRTLLLDVVVPGGDRRRAADGVRAAAVDRFRISGGPRCTGGRVQHGGGQRRSISADPRVARSDGHAVQLLAAVRGARRTRVRRRRRRSPWRRADDWLGGTFVDDRTNETGRVGDSGFLLDTLLQASPAHAAASRVAARTAGVDRSDPRASRSATRTARTPGSLRRRCAWRGTRFEDLGASSGSSPTPAR